MQYEEVSSSLNLNLFAQFHLLWLKIIFDNVKNNKTPLHIAAEKDSYQFGELLISKGADINAKSIIYQIRKQ